MIRRGFCVFLLILAGVAPWPDRSSAGAEIAVRPSVWRPNVSAELQTTTSGVRESRFDLVDDAGLIEKRFLEGEIRGRRDRLELRARYTPALMNGNKVLEREIVFAGLTYPAGSPVRSHICVDLADLEVQYDAIRFGAGMARIALGAAAKIRYMNARAELHTANRSERRSFATPLPAAGVSAAVSSPRNRMRLDLRSSWGGYSVNRTRDWEANLSLAVLPRTRVQGGYRYVDLDVDAHDILAAIKMRGPYLGTEVSF